MSESFVQKSADILFLRVGPGEELFKSIFEACKEHGVTSGSVISCLGSLAKTTYTYIADSKDSPLGVKYLDTVVYERPVEVICAHGTIGLNKDTGELDMHMHAMFVNSEPKLLAGHLLEGCTACATLEIAIAISRDSSIVRGMDPQLNLPVFRYGKL